MTEAYDENGNRLYPVTICTICPIANDLAGRQACLDYWQACEDYPDHTVDSMLSDVLGPIGSVLETHSYCMRAGYTHQQNRLRGYLAAIGSINPIINPSFVTLQDDPNAIKSKLCVFIGSGDEFLSHLGLEVKRTR